MQISIKKYWRLSSLSNYKKMKISNLVTQKKNINPNESQTTLSVSENYGIVPQDFLFKKKNCFKR